MKFTKIQFIVLIVLLFFLCAATFSLFQGCTIGTTHRVTINQYGDGDTVSVVKNKRYNTVIIHYNDSTKK